VEEDSYQANQHANDDDHAMAPWTMTMMLEKHFFHGNLFVFVLLWGKLFQGF